MISRVQQIKEKGFDMVSDVIPTADRPHAPQDFSKIKVGRQNLNDPVLTLADTYESVNPRLGSKKFVVDAIDRMDLVALREISNFFYRVSGIYARFCKYLASLYRYDWYVTPYVNSDKVSDDKAIEGFKKSLDILDGFGVKKFFNETSLKVVKNGCYYGYIVESPSGYQVQELPIGYCRSRYEVAGKPAVEFNMKYFDDKFKDVSYRMRVLKLFPPEFKKGYDLYKRGKLIPDYTGDTSGWYLLDIDSTVKFNLNGSDLPVLIAVIPDIIDLNEGQGLNKKRLKQELLKIIIQKMPIDKNGDLIFDVDEARQLHANAVGMVGNLSEDSIKVLTTFADVAVEDMADTSNTTTSNALDAIRNNVYDNAGISQLQFNSEGNIALQYSISNDEAFMMNLIQQYEIFLNTLLIKLNKNPKRIKYQAQILPTTIYNHKDMAKLYKENVQYGYSKIFPMLALGQSQSSILATAQFENEVLNLVDIFVPLQSSATMSNKNGESKGGRPEKEDTEKSEKTMQNLESQA